MINIKNWVKNAIVSRGQDRKRRKKCNNTPIPYDKRFATGRFVLFQHNRMAQEKSNWYVEEPKIGYIIKDTKLASLTLQYRDWQFQWEI